MRCFSYFRAVVVIFALACAGEFSGLRGDDFAPLFRAWLRSDPPVEGEKEPAAPKQAPAANQALAKPDLPELPPTLAAHQAESKGAALAPAEAVLPENPPALAANQEPTGVIPWLPPGSNSADVWFGTSYFSVPGESSFGGAYGGDFSLQLWGPYQLWNILQVNHLSNGSQILGSVGFRREPRYDPFSLVVLFDQYTDTRISGLYLSQLRALAGWRVTREMEVGATFSVPVTGDNNVLFFDPLAGFTNGSLRQARSVGVYVAGPVGPARVHLLAGYRGSPDVFTLGAGANMRLTSRMSTFLNAAYEDRGSWGGSMGLAFSLGRSPGRSQGTASGVDGSWRDEETIRGLIPGGSGWWSGDADGNGDSDDIIKATTPTTFSQSTTIDGMGTVVGTHQKSNVEMIPITPGVE